MDTGDILKISIGTNKFKDKFRVGDSYTHDIKSKYNDIHDNVNNIHEDSGTMNIIRCVRNVPNMISIMFDRSTFTYSLAKAEFNTKAGKPLNINFLGDKKISIYDQILKNVKGVDAQDVMIRKLNKIINKSDNILVNDLITYSYDFIDNDNYSSLVDVSGYVHWNVEKSEKEFVIGKNFNIQEEDGGVVDPKIRIRINREIVQTFYTICSGDRYFDGDVWNRVQDILDPSILIDSPDEPYDWSTRKFAIYTPINFIKNNPNKKWNLSFLGANIFVTIEFVLENQHLFDFETPYFNICENESITQNDIKNTLLILPWNKNWMVYRYPELIDIYPDFDYDYEILSSSPNITIEFLKTHDDIIKKLNWESITSSSGITWENISETPKLPWERGSITYNPNITWKIVKNNPNIPWNYYTLTNIIGVDWDFINANPDNEYNWDIISESPCIKWNFIKRHKEKINWYILSSNSSITIDIVKNNLDEPWVHSELSVNPNMTEDIAIKTPFIDWDYESLNLELYWKVKRNFKGPMENSNVTWKLIKANPEMPWFSYDFPPKIIKEMINDIYVEQYKKIISESDLEIRWVNQGIDPEIQKDRHIMFNDMKNIGIYEQDAIFSEYDNENIYEYYKTGQYKKFNYPDRISKTRKQISKDVFNNTMDRIKKLYPFDQEPPLNRVILRGDDYGQDYYDEEVEAYEMEIINHENFITSMVSKTIPFIVFVDALSIFPNFKEKMSTINDNNIDYQAIQLELEKSTLMMENMYREHMASIKIQNAWNISFDNPRTRRGIRHIFEGMREVGFYSESQEFTPEIEAELVGYYENYYENLN
jgi:hypothetical protein